MRIGEPEFEEEIDYEDGEYRREEYVFFRRNIKCMLCYQDS